MKAKRTGLSLILIVFLLSCASSQQGRRGDSNQNLVRESLRQNRNEQKVQSTYFGNASYYAEEFQGRKTASGEIYDMSKYTAAHRTLPFGTICRVTNLKTNKTVVVRINDRGPFVHDRILDLSKGAAQALDGISQGIMEVKIEILEMPE
jgi:rare lipoprotein A